MDREKYLITLALNPAFSPEEKENRLPCLEKDQAAGMVGRIDESSGIVSRENPLPGGEDTGEGERQN